MSSTSVNTNHDLEPPPTVKRRKVNRACVECTRRKIRCDGSHPCNNCEWYSVQQRCSYRQRNRRTNPTWKTVEELSAALDTRNEVLSKLIPSIDFSNFPGLSKEKVLQLVSGDPDIKSHSSTNGIHLPSHASPQNTHVTTDVDDSEHEWDESKRAQDATSPIGDDVNGITVQKRPASYLGATSISAALRVLCAICPPAKREFIELGKSFSLNKPASKDNSNEHRNTSDISGAPTSEEAAINAYFEIAHGGLTMMDEEWFRTVFTSNVRKDDAWTALLNAVCALGSIAAGDDVSHAFYYDRAKNVIGYNVFGSGNLEMLQALILIGGSYLHYTNSPNTAYLIIGTAFRMAIAMALHRESVHSQRPQIDKGDPSTEQIERPHRPSRAEIRRRTWWALVYVDTCGGIQTGRPAIGRWDPSAMDISLPGEELFPPGCDMEMKLASGASDVDFLLGLSARLRAEFSKIHLKIEYRLVQFSRMSAREVLSFETQLQAWYMTLPPVFKHMGSCHPKLRYSRDVMYGRYLFTLLLLSRPFLLQLAQDPSAPQTFTTEDWRVVSICQEAAAAIIEFTHSGMVKNRIFVWLATFNLFQACQVTLISMILGHRGIRIGNPGLESVDTCQKTITRALQTYSEIEPYTRTIDKFGQVVKALYDGVLIYCQSDRSTAVPNPINELDGNNAWPDTESTMFNFADTQDFNATPDWFDYNLVFGDELNWPASMDQWGQLDLDAVFM